MTPSERLSLAIHMESAAIAPQTSELIEAAKEVLRENERMRQSIDLCSGSCSYQQTTVCSTCGGSGVEKAIAGNGYHWCPDCRRD